MLKDMYQNTNFKIGLEVGTGVSLKLIVCIIVHINFIDVIIIQKEIPRSVVHFMHSLFF